MLNWTTTKTLNNTLHSATELASEENILRKAIEACADKAISLLNTNIQDDSLYLLFEWNEALAKLSVVVTDSTKKNDSQESVHCTFANLAQSNINQTQSTAHTAAIKFWLHDYLTTCAAFFNYSLVAIFHNNQRSNTELL